MHIQARAVGFFYYLSVLWRRIVMRLIQSVVCMCALALALPAWGEGEEGAADEVSSETEQLLNLQLAERLKTFLISGLVRSEELSKFIDKDYWNAIKADFSAVAAIIEEDDFIQAALPIIASVRIELSELVKIAVEELLTHSEQTHSEQIATKVIEIISDLRQKAVLIVEQALVKIKEIAATKPVAYKALLSKVGAAVDQTARSVAEGTTLLVAAVLLDDLGI